MKLTLKFLLAVAILVVYDLFSGGEVIKKDGTSLLHG